MLLAPRFVGQGKFLSPREFNICPAQAEARESLFRSLQPGSSQALDQVSSGRPGCTLGICTSWAILLSLPSSKPNAFLLVSAWPWSWSWKVAAGHLQVTIKIDKCRSSQDVPSQECYLISPNNYEHLLCEMLGCNGETRHGPSIT